MKTEWDSLNEALGLEEYECECEEEVCFEEFEE